MLNRKEYYKKWYIKNCERLKENYLKNKKQKIEYAKKYRLKNKEKIKEKKKIYLLKNKEKLIKKRKENYLLNKEKILKRNKKWFLKNKTKVMKQRLIREKERYHSDIRFRLEYILRRRVSLALRGFNKSKNTIKLLGVPNIEFLKKYLENKFKPGMSWKKRGLIHIDHIIPCASFDLTDPKQQAICFHYTNLQPLWAKENLIKGAKLLKFQN